MPDLSKDGVNQFWHEYRDPAIYRLICFMESVENWVPEDSEELEAAIDKLGATLDDIGNRELGNDDKFIKTCCSLSSGRSLRLLQILDIANPGAASRLLIHAEEETKNEKDLHAVFLRRNIVFERLRLMTRVFSKQRMELVLRALENDDE